MNPPGVFDFRRHFLFLAGAIVILGCLSRLPLYGDALFASAVNGALHACAVVSSLRVTATGCVSLFRALAAALSIMTLYVAIIVLVALSILPDSQRLPAVVGIAAMDRGADLRFTGALVLDSRREAEDHFGIVDILCARNRGRLLPEAEVQLGRHVVAGRHLVGDLLALSAAHARSACGECTCSGRTPRPMSRAGH